MGRRGRRLRETLFSKKKEKLFHRHRSSPPDRNFIVILLLYFGQHIKNFLRDLERGRVPVWNEGGGGRKSAVLKFAVGDCKANSREIQQGETFLNEAFNDIGRKNA